jgi:ABC-2 type transport system ATP-binding protein
MYTSDSPGDGIIANSVSRSFGDVHAVVDASFHARPGEVTALIGPNGSGKTTLMLMLASLLRPDSGEISVGGFNPMTDTAAVRARHPRFVGGIERARHA